MSFTEIMQPTAPSIYSEMCQQDVSYHNSFCDLFLILPIPKHISLLDNCGISVAGIWRMGKTLKTYCSRKMLYAVPLQVDGDIYIQPATVVARSSEFRSSLL